MSRTNTVILVILILLVGYQQSQLDSIKQHVTTQAFIQACVTNLVYRNTITQECSDEEKLPQEHTVHLTQPPVTPTNINAHVGKSNNSITARVEPAHPHITTLQCSTWNICSLTSQPRNTLH